jgi:signal transduction histidine kinase/CheY-like chemotaxis protein
MMRDISQAVLDRPFVRYATAVVVLAASFFLRYFLVQGLGLSLPPFVTFYPAIMLVAFLAGLWSGLLATALVALAADYFFLPPFGFGIASMSDVVALALFALMGIFMSLVAEGYRRSLLSIAAYKVEQALWVSNKKLDVALASMTDAVFISDAKGQFIQFNDAFAFFHKFRNKSECARALAEYPEFLEVSMADGQLAPLEMWAVPRALRGETAANEEYRLRRKDTGETWIGSYSFAPVRDQEGAIIGSVVVGRDITEQKIAEQKLRESEASLAVAQARARLGSWEADLATWEAKWSAEMSRLYYRDPSSAAPAFEEFLQMVHPEDREVLASQRDGIADFGDPFEFESRTNPSIGPMRYLSNTFYVIRDAAGSPTRLGGTSQDITERKRAEEELRKSETLYHGLFDSMDEGFCVIEMIFDAEGKPADYRFLEINAAFEKQTGMHDAVGKRMRELAPTHEEYWFEIYGKIALTGEPEHFLNEAKALNCYYEVSAYRIGEPDLRQVAIVFSDISERRRAEKHIQQLNRVYSVLSDINQTIVREKDSQTMLEAACRIATEKGKFRMAWIGMADSAAHMLRPIASSGEVGDYLDHIQLNFLDPARSAGPSVRCFLSGEHAVCNAIEQDPSFAPWRNDAFRMGYRSHASFPLKVDAQVVGIFNLYSSELAFFDEDEIKLLDELAMDIGFALEMNRREEDRRKAEEELRWRTAFFEAQVDSAQDGVLVLDSKGNKILQNRRMNELLKIPQHISENTDNAPQLEYVATLLKNPGEFADKVNDLAFHPDKIGREEIELLDGTILEEYSSPVRDKERNYYGRIWTIRDITERRQLEEQFRQSQKMEAVGQLTGGIAHDFNNLLTVILGCSEFIVEEAKENPRLSKMAKMILDAAQRGADLTHRMLAFARRQALQPKPIDVNRLLANMESFMRRTLSADIDMEVIQSGEDCTALVDLTQLESALLNLCVNARDAMAGGGKLIVETGIATLDSSYAEQNPDVTPGQYILISVSDTGCGISPENLARVFDPFFTTKEVGKGTGLGLSMVYGFVKQSQGHVKIYSEPGKGTSVKLYLPMADQKSEPSNQEADLIADLQGSEKILLVEDNTPVREFAKTQLLHFGYQVLEAANGKDALAVLREHKDIDLLFTDVVMPGGLNGRELAHEARKLYPALKVLFCSGYAESAILHLGLLDEHVQLLNKPYSRLQLARRIRGMLTASQSAPAEEERNG